MNNSNAQILTDDERMTFLTQLCERAVENGSFTSFAVSNNGLNNYIAKLSWEGEGRKARIHLSFDRRGKHYAAKDYVVASFSGLNDQRKKRSMYVHSGEQDAFILAIEAKIVPLALADQDTRIARSKYDKECQKKANESRESWVNFYPELSRKIANKEPVGLYLPSDFTFQPEGYDYYRQNSVIVNPRKDQAGDVDVTFAGLTQDQAMKLIELARDNGYLGAK